MLHKIKKIFLVLFCILTISYSQYIFAADDFILPEGMLRYENPDVHSGLVILLGKRMVESSEDAHHLSKLEDLNIDLKRDMEAAHAARAVNILYINLHDSEFNLKDIGKAIKEFSNKNQEISIVSIIHGAAIFPMSSHTINAGPEAPDSLFYNLVGYYISPNVSNYLAGHFIPSSEFFKVISNAVGNKSIKMWQCSCQGSKTIKDAQNILPKNSIFVTESKGWVERPDCLMYALSRVLRSGVAFNFHALLANYAYTPNLFKQKFRYNDYYDGYELFFNINPIYTVIGEKSISLVDRADEFLVKCRSNQIDSKRIQQTLDKLCNLIIPLGNNFLDTCVANGEQELRKIIDKGAFIADCTTHNGEMSYVMEELMGIFKKDQYTNPECELNWARYMFLISLGAATIEENLVEQLPEIN